MLLGGLLEVCRSSQSLRGEGESLPAPPRRAAGAGWVPQSPKSLYPPCPRVPVPQDLKDFPRMFYVSGHVMIYRTIFHVPSPAAKGSVNVFMKSLYKCRAMIIKAKGTFVLLAWHLWGRSRAQGLSTEHELPESSMGWC